MDIRIELQPKQSLLDHTIEQTPVTLYGGAKGGGKSMGLRLIMLKRRFQYPGSSGVIFRKTFPELEKNHIRPLLEGYPGLKRFYNEGKRILTLPNRSTLEFAFCAKKSDLGKYQGQEYHDLAIEEAGEWPEGWFQTLRGSNRTGKAGIPVRTILTANPGGIGHAWLKRLFITRVYDSARSERPEDYAFIKALVTDNPALMRNDPDYVRRLDAEKNEMLRRAYRWGDWDIAAGQFFSELSRDIHYLEKFTIPKHWTRFHSYDYGFNHPACYLWWAVDEDGNLYVYRELYQAHLRVDQQAKLVKETKDLAATTWAGHDCWTKKGQKGPTIAEEFREYGITLKQANISRKQGAAQLRARLAWEKQDHGGKEVQWGPRIFFVNTPLTFECVSRMVHDESDAEDVRKVDSEDGDPMDGDDGYDCARYGVMSRPIRAILPKTPTEQDRYRNLLRRGRVSWTTA
jgi:phage terminase large subunit